MNAVRVVACVPDLMDRSKLEAAARTAEVALELVGQPSGLAVVVRGSRAGWEPSEGRDSGGPGEAPGADLLILDLSRAGALDAIRALSGEVRTVGFGSHVDRELLSSAREAGCAQVMARSAFFGRLSDLLGGLRSGAGGVAPAQASAAISSSEVIGSENIGKS